MKIDSRIDNNYKINKNPQFGATLRIFGTEAKPVETAFERLTKSVNADVALFTNGADPKMFDSVVTSSQNAYNSKHILRILSKEILNSASFFKGLSTKDVDVQIAKKILENLSYYMPESDFATLNAKLSKAFFSS